MITKIYGYGWVGKAMKSLFPGALIHDPYQGFVNKEKADIAFVCVPTPLHLGKEPMSSCSLDGHLDCSIVEQVVKDSKEDLIIIRSTVMPGTCDSLKKNIVYMPEYLGESIAHPLLDEKKRNFLIIGGEPRNRRKAIELFQQVYNANISIKQVTNYEAEVIKLSENRTILHKIIECQELYDACEKAGVDYYTVRDAVYGDDPRMSLWWTFVYPDKRGANSKCIPKDVYGWCAWAESAGFEPKLTKTVLEVNNGLISNNTK